MKALAILALLLVPVSVHAQKTAKQLAEACTAGDADHPVSQAFCVGYIDGTLDAYMAMAAFDALAEREHFELTGKYSTFELRDAFLAYLKDHPERNSQYATPALVFAWLEHKMIRLVTPTKEEKKP